MKNNNYKMIEDYKILSYFTSFIPMMLRLDKIINYIKILYNEVVMKFKLMQFRTKLMYTSKFIESPTNSKATMYTTRAIVQLITDLIKSNELVVNKCRCTRICDFNPHTFILLMQEFNKIIKIADDIYVYAYMPSTKSNIYCFNFLSKKLSVEDIIRFINMKIRVIYKNEFKTNIYYIFNKSENSKKVVKHFSTKYYENFDNIFFKDKEVLLSKLNKFLNCKDEYKRKGLPYNLGFILYGESVFNKNYCIKAIENYTKVNLQIINLSIINTVKRFIANLKVGYKLNRIIVLENIDDVTLLSTLENDLTIDRISNVMNGLVEHNNRILIIKTNYPERLKHLVMPGLIDEIINVDE